MEAAVFDLFEEEKTVIDELGELPPRVVIHKQTLKLCFPSFGWYFSNEKLSKKRKL